MTGSLLGRCGFVLVLLASFNVNAQTFTVCDPLKELCRPCAALGRAASVNFVDGASGLFTAVSSPRQIRYTSGGVEFSISDPGQSPTLQSVFYIMFGRVEVHLKASPGIGIVSSFVLQSDDLDEIDLEWLGGDPHRFQSNFFSKGDTTTYDRGEFHNLSGLQSEFHNYTIDWTDEETTWYVDGSPVRQLQSTSPSGYPQTPMAIRLGLWAGGDPSNPPGTISWAGGVTDFNNGPFSCTVRSITVKDYSTGYGYSYGDQSGSWTSIQALGGEIKGDVGGPLVYSSEPTYSSLHTNSLQTPDDRVRPLIQAHEGHIFDRHTEAKKLHSSSYVPVNLIAVETVSRATRLVPWLLWLWPVILILHWH